MREILHAGKRPRATENTETVLHKPWIGAILQYKAGFLPRQVTPRRILGRVSDAAQNTGSPFVIYRKHPI